jgi:hypothetical protein
MTDITVSADKSGTKVRRAEHVLIDGNGNAVDEEVDAQGYTYKVLGASQDFTWKWSDANDDERRMLALFGAKTLATNVASGKRQKDGDDMDGQMDAVVARFANIRKGQWTEPGEGGGFAIKPELLAQAINNVRQAMGKAVTDVGELMKRIAEETGYSAKARKVPEVAAEYARLAGRSTVTIDDL